MADSSSLPPSPESSSAPQKTYRIMTIMAATALILLGFAIFSLSRMSSSPTPEENAAAPSSRSSSLEEPNIQELKDAGQDLPSFEFVDGEVTLSPQSFDGQWTLLNFWSMGCADCVAELPGLDQLAVNWQGPEFEVITLNLDKAEAIDQAKRLLEEQEISLPTLYDRDGVLRKAFSIPDSAESLPRHFLISPDRKIMWLGTGAFSWSDGAARDQLLKVMELHTPHGRNFDQEGDQVSPPEPTE